MTRKKNIAKSAGYFQLTLAIFGFIEVIRRFIGTETVPTFSDNDNYFNSCTYWQRTLFVFTAKSKSREAHMQASMIFTSNDVM
jgi:hypothetical protein